MNEKESILHPLLVENMDASAAARYLGEPRLVYNVVFKMVDGLEQLGYIVSMDKLFLV